jgi:hypothetical protein
MKSGYEDLQAGTSIYLSETQVNDAEKILFDGSSISLNR